MWMVKEAKSEGGCKELEEGLGQTIKAFQEPAGEEDLGKETKKQSQQGQEENRKL